MRLPVEHRVQGTKLGLPYAEQTAFVALPFLSVIALLPPRCCIGRAAWPASPTEAWHVVISGVLMQGVCPGDICDLIQLCMPPGVLALVAWPLFGEVHTVFSAAGMALVVPTVWLATQEDRRTA